MNLPFLSPYLHPMWLSGTDGRQELWFEHCIGGRRHQLTPDEVRLVSLLWPRSAGQGTPPDAPDGLRALADDIGPVHLSNGLRSLFERGFLFSDPTSCDQVLLSTVESFLMSVPLVDQIEVTNRCPMRCRFCPRGIPGAITRPYGRMRLELFEVLLTQLAERQRSYHPLELDLMGESLLHPQVDRFVEAASRRGIRSELSVNPSLLTPELSRRLIRAGIARLVISLDGMSNAVLAAMRGKAANYDTAATNLAALFDVAQERSDPPQIVIQMIDFDRNRSQQKAFLETWGHTGKPFVTAYIKPLDGPDPDSGRRHETTTRFLCTYPFTSVTVLWDGSVVPCCRDANGRYPLGNLNENSLEEIWRGPRAEQLREAYRRDEFGHGHLCEECPWRRSRYAAALWERHPERAVFEPMHW